MNKYIYILFIFISSHFVFTQKLVTQSSELELFKTEINSIENKSIDNSLFISSYIEKEPKPYRYINLLKRFNLKHLLIIEPTMAIRYSSKGFEVYNENSSSLWLSPGLRMSSNIPLFQMVDSMWMYIWADFYKHSLITKENINYTDDLFVYNPNYNTSFYTLSVKPKNSIDFDQSQAGISLLSNNFEIIFGKLNSSFGSFYSGNLSISNNAPPFPQILIKYKHEKFIFSYLIGSLDSNIPKSISEDSLYVDLWEWDNINLLSNQLSSNRSQVYPRYVAYHRIDFKPKSNIRFGIYEELIFSRSSIPFSYMIPVMPFWSSQHEGGDLDNLFMGFDFDVIFNSNNNKNHRIYGSLLIDEWAPFSTFSKDERNWFAYQLGYSRVDNLFSKELLSKIEYTKIDPRVYNHRFIINEPKHYGYNLGFWSGNHSDNIALVFAVLLKNDNYLKLSYAFTRFANESNSIDLLEKQYYDIEIDFLGDNYNYRGEISLLYSVLLKKQISLDIDLSSFNTSGLYLSDDFFDITLKLRYNITK